MKVTLEKKYIKSLYSGEFYIYKYTEQLRWRHTDFYLPPKTVVYEEYDQLLNTIRLKFIDLDKVTEFKGISREEILRDVERLKDENKFRWNTSM